ncbi:MAG: universal stress protein [Cytophagales bacterium]|nr:universal stress protein [Cytophagales bacterium]
MQKILVPTDFSEQANNAVDLASKLAQKMDAEVILLHVVEDNSVTSVHVTGEIDLPDMQDRLFVLKLIEKAKTNLADAVAKYSDVNIKKEIRIGNAYHNIKDIITGHDVDLVVMGTKGTNTLTEVLMGSNAEKVVRHAACPVLTLKQGAEDAEFKNIVFATGLNDQDNSCTQVVRDFQTIFNAKIHVVRINTPNNFEPDHQSVPDLEKYAEKCGFSDYDIHVFNDVSEEDGIMHFADGIKADMIAMATHGRTGFAHLLTGSIAEDVVNHAKRPVLTYVLKK